MNRRRVLGGMVSAGVLLMLVVSAFPAQQPPPPPFEYVDTWGSHGRDCRGALRLSGLAPAPAFRFKRRVRSKHFR